MARKMEQEKQQQRGRTGRDKSIEEQDQRSSRRRQDSKNQSGRRRDEDVEE